MPIAVLRWSALGDIAAALPVLRACMPSHELTIITTPLGQALMADEWDRFLILENKHWHSQIQLWRQLWRRFEVIVDLQSNDRSRLLTHLSACPVVNSTGVNLNQPVTAIFHAIAHQSGYFKPLDTQWKADRERSYIVLNAGSSAGWPSKRLPLAQWQTFSQLLWERYGLPFLWTGATEERDYIETVSRHCVGRGEVVAGKTTLPELKQLLTQAWLTLSTDSGPMHLSAAQKTPTIGLFGATNWIRSAPFGPWSTVLFDPVYYPSGQPPAQNQRQLGPYYDHIRLEPALERLGLL